MKAIITQIESVVTPSGNSGNIVVLKVWIGKEVVVTQTETAIPYSSPDLCLKGFSTYTLSVIVGSIYDVSENSDL